MTDEACPRCWEVEAAHDGRLDDAALQAHRDHVSRCLACQRERSSLASYLKAMRSIASVDDDVTRQRIKQRVLAALHRPRSEPTSRRSAYGLVAAAAIAFASAALLRGPPSQPTHDAAAVTVSPQGTAHWQRSLEPNVERVILTAGTLSFRVVHAPGSRRLTVVVPEGEIEDIGTTFRVTVEHARTVAIRVDEGRVVFRRRGEPDMQLLAGSDWSPATDTSAPSDVAAPTSTADAPRGAPEHGAGRDGPRARRQQPDGLSAEDEAYLRVIHHVRSNLRRDAKAASERYLQRFPNGLRRPEVERLLRELDDRPATAGRP